MKGAPQKSKPKLAGLDERDFTTSETDVPVPYFAGVAKLSWSQIMSPIITKTVNTPTPSGKK